jgi:hypothetical protein
MKVHKFKSGDWVDIISGPHKGKSTTVEDVDKTICTGYYCGKLLIFKHSEAKPYKCK